jgi:hypothetical protein
MRLGAPRTGDTAGAPPAATPARASALVGTALVDGRIWTVRLQPVAAPAKLQSA